MGNTSQMDLPLLSSLEGGKAPMKRNSDKAGQAKTNDKPACPPSDKLAKDFANFTKNIPW